MLQKVYTRVERLQKEIVALCSQIEREAVYGVAATLISTGESLFIRADEKFPTASVIKIAIVCELHTQAAEGRLSLDSPYDNCRR